jgi:hypothetical protein
MLVRFINVKFTTQKKMPAEFSGWHFLWAR